MWVTIYTDASWMPDKKEGGWGFWAKSNLGRITKHGKLPKWVTCNNTAEMAAIITGVEEVFKEWGSEVSGILICTDSEVSMVYLKYRPNGTDSLKRKDWLPIREGLYKLLDDHKCKMKIRHVKGHQSANTKQAWLNNKVDQFTRKSK